MRYVGVGGGKRLRPLLTVATGRLFGLGEDRAVRAGSAIEAIHVYSLIHDDLPCMDDDDLRRGKPTVHKAFGEATAILAGDCFHDLAFEIIADAATHEDPFVRAELVLEMARASGPHGMAGGQMLDLAAQGHALDIGTITRLQQLKTGALIEFAVEAACIMGRIAPEGRTPYRGYARDIGLAFQIADAGKATFVSLLGEDRARQQCSMLVGQALDHLRDHGPEADLLRAIARYVEERDR
jgi:farnesyl diphosphate synthase